MQSMQQSALFDTLTFLLLKTLSTKTQTNHIILGYSGFTNIIFYPSENKKSVSERLKIGQMGHSLYFDGILVWVSSESLFNLQKIPWACYNRGLQVMKGGVSSSWLFGGNFKKTIWRAKTGLGLRASFEDEDNEEKGDVDNRRAKCRKNRRYIFV